MNAEVEWTAPVRLTLEDSIWDEHHGHGWVRVVGLLLDDEQVRVITEDPVGELVLPAVVPVRTRRMPTVIDEQGVDEQMSSWYAGDVSSIGAAVAAHAQAVPPGVSATGGRPVPAFARDPELVGIYGGDLDAIVDAFGASGDVDARARRQAAFERGMAHVHHHEPVASDPDSEDAVSEQIAGYYGGDLGSVVPHWHWHSGE